MNFNRMKELHSLDAVRKEQQPRRWKRICYTYEAMRINESTWRRIHYEYDRAGRLIKQTETDPDCGICRVYEYQYDCADNLTKRIEHRGEEQLNRHYRYNSRNLLTHYIDEEGGVTRIYYDKNARICKVIRPEQYDSETDDGMGFSYLYNHQDLLLKVIGADGNALESYTYDNAGNITSTTDANGGTITYQYNSFGELYEIMDQDGNWKRCIIPMTFRGIF